LGMRHRSRSPESRKTGKEYPWRESPKPLAFCEEIATIAAMVFWGGEGLASLIASDLRGPAAAPGFSFFGACLLSFNRSKYYMLNRSGCHALGAACFLRLIPDSIRIHSRFARRISAMSARAWKGRDCAPSGFVAITHEPLLEIEKRRGWPAPRALGDRQASAPCRNGGKPVGGSRSVLTVSDAPVEPGTMRRGLPVPPRKKQHEDGAAVR
jgi:hypothetical protein